MLDIEKTLQSVRDLLDRLGKEGVEFALVESEYSDYVADIRNPNKVYVFLECSIRPNGTFVWRDYDHHKGVCDFDEFRVRIITLTANKYLDKAKDKRKQWASLCEGTDTPMPESLAVTVSDMENKANRLKALLEPDDPPLLDGRDIAILKELKPYGAFLPTRNSDGSAMRSRRTCRMRAIWTTTACSTAPGVRPWIAATRCLMRANTAYPACSSHSTTRPYGRRYAPDLTC